MPKFKPKYRIAEIFPDHKRKIKKLFRRLNLKNEQFSEVQTAVKKRNYIAACSHLLDYYRENRAGDICDYKMFHRVEEDEALLEDIFNDTFTFQTVRDAIPRTSDEHLNWSYTGPNDDKEFGYFLNRQKYMFRLWDAYKRTKDEKYAVKFDELMQDWLLENPRPWFYRSSVQWRTLEVALRSITAWTSTFFGFQQAEGFSPATRILMLAAVYDHAEYCRKYVVKRGNIRVMILNALGSIAAFWPEFKKAKHWMKTAIAKMEPEIVNIQVYKEGPQKELTNHYHSVALLNFEHFSEIVKRNPWGLSLSSSYIDQLERMWNYYAYNMRPNGYGLLNNDADYDYVKERVIEASQRYNRTDWLYIAENGKKGEKPESSSVVFPKAGHYIGRNGWKKNSEWCFFDFGPFGTGHQHRDKLHISIFAYGEDLLVDSGRYWYKRGDWRNYFRGTSSHNTIMIDGKGQNRYQKERSESIRGENYHLEDGYDYAFGIFNGGYGLLSGSPIHRRAFIYMHGEYWLVVDLIETDSNHQITVNWHFHPDLAIEFLQNAVRSVNLGRPNVKITHSENMSWKRKLVRGQTEPEIQGWYSREYNHKTEAYCAEFSTEINEDSAFAWVIKADPGEPMDEDARISVKQISEMVCEVFIDNKTCIVDFAACNIDWEH